MPTTDIPALLFLWASCRLVLSSAIFNAFPKGNHDAPNLVLGPRNTPYRWSYESTVSPVNVLTA